MPAQVNYWLVDEGQLRVCDHSSLITTSQLNAGLAYWNSGLGTSFLVNSCTDFGVELIDVANGDCGFRANGDPVGACAAYPGVDSPQVLKLKVTPFLPNESSASDDVAFPFIIAHELGHNLGFDHTFSSNCAASIMNDPRCDPPIGSLTQLDKDNYHNGYHADAVTTSFSGSPAAPHAIAFTWDGSDIHNERVYLINWRNNCTGQWQIFATADKNSSSKTLTNLQGGDQEFQILPLTNADPEHNFAGDTRNVMVNVVASLLAPAGLASTFPSTTVNRFEWPAVTGAHHYKIRTDISPTGVGFPSCVGANPDDQIEGTQYDAPVPPPLFFDHWYTRVLACTAASLCSPLSPAYTLVQHFDSGAWDYAFTYYRSVDDINLEFINFNPNLMALQLDILNGTASSSPLVTSSACIPTGAIGSVGPMSASSFSSGNLATRGHGVQDADICAPTHANDSTTVGSGQIPPQAGPCCATPTPTPIPGPVGGIAELPAIDGAALEAGSASGTNGGVLASIAAAVAGVVALGGAAWYARRRQLR